MPHTRKKRKAQERKRNPKHYESTIKRIRPDDLVDSILLALADNAFTIEEFKNIAKEVLRRYAQKDNT